MPPSLGAACLESCVLLAAILSFHECRMQKSENMIIQLKVSVFNSQFVGPDQPHSGKNQTTKVHVQ